MKKISLKRDNRGASLLAVLILMVVVSAIAVVITKITIVNIQMKEVERGTKKNFYSADAVMDDLRTGARELAEKSLEKAYTDVLENYLTYTASGANAQDVFSRKYMEDLEGQFAKASAGKTNTTDASGNVVYTVSDYNTDTVKGCIKETAEQGCYVVAADPKYELDYGAGTFTLKGVQVKYKDAQDYETKITTDLIFSTPQMNFSGQGQIQEFMKYALIADRQIHVNASNVQVDGSVYAGWYFGRQQRKRNFKGKVDSHTRRYRDGQWLYAYGRKRKFFDLGGKYKDLGKRIFHDGDQRKYVCGR
jgi:Tfp pilus assembly protein PilX